MHRFLQQECTQFFAKWRTARLARRDHRLAAGAQLRSYASDMGGFTRAVYAFKGDEFTGCHDDGK